MAHDQREKLAEDPIEGSAYSLRYHYRTAKDSRGRLSSSVSECACGDGFERHMLTFGAVEPAPVAGWWRDVARVECKPITQRKIDAQHAACRAEAVRLVEERRAYIRTLPIEDVRKAAR